MRRLCTCLVIVCALLATACVSHRDDVLADRDGIGGTGRTANTEGIGGTGVHGGDDDGIGGTGIWAHAGTGDIAIVGAITALDALEINNYGFLVPDSLAVAMNGRTESTAVLQLGQVVELRAGLVNGIPTAKAIQIFDPVVGLIERHPNPDGTLFVHGQAVRITERTRIDIGGVDTPDAVQSGTRIRVSGYRDSDGQIIATLLTDQFVGMSNVVSGRLTVDESGLARVGNYEFAVTPNLRNGDVVLLTKAPAEAPLIVARDPYPYRGAVDRLSIESVPTTLGARMATPSVAAHIDPMATARSGAVASTLVGRPARFEISVTGPAQLTLDRVEPIVPGINPNDGLMIPQFVPPAPNPIFDYAPRPTTTPTTPDAQITLPRSVPGDRPTTQPTTPTRPIVRPPSTVPPDVRPAPTTKGPVTLPRPSISDGVVPVP